MAVHEAKFRWALERIMDGHNPYGFTAERMAEEVLKQADALDAQLDHKYHHVRPHPNGGTWPYYQPVCTCDQFDGSLLCQNCGKPMADHDDMAHCWVRALPDHSDGQEGGE